jgi:hypothetical protein
MDDTRSFADRPFELPRERAGTNQEFLHPQPTLLRKPSFDHKIANGQKSL